MAASRFIELFGYVVLGTGIIYVAMAMLCLQNLHVKGAKILFAITLASSIYNIGYFFELHNSAISAIYGFICFEYIGIAFIPTLWLLFIMDYTDNYGYIKKYRTAMIGYSVFVVAVVATNPMHHLYYKEIILQNISGHTIALTVKGPLYWVNQVYNNLTAIAASVFIFIAAYRATPVYRLRYIILFIGSLFPWISILVYTAGQSPYGLDISAFGLLLAGLACVYNFFCYGLLGLLPLARSNIFESITDCILIMDTKGNIADINSSAAAMLGDKSDIIGKHANSILHFLSGLNYEKLTGRVVYEGELHTKKGIRFVEAKLSNIIGRFKLGRGRFVIIRDITQEKEIRDRYHALFNTLFDSFFVSAILRDESGNPYDYKFLDVNPAFEKALGLSRNEVIGKTIISCLPWLKKYMADIFNQVAITGKTVRFEAYFDTLNRYLQFLVFRPTKDTLASLFVDTTDRKRAEKELFQEKERLDVTLRSIADGVIATDGEGRVTIMNSVAEFLTGWKLDEALGLPLERIFNIKSEDNNKSCQNPVEMVLKTGKTTSLANNTVLYSRNGAVIPIADKAAPILDNYGKTVGAVLVFRDVTSERKQHEEILYLSYHDGLTGLYNRLFFEKKMAHMDKEGRLPLSIIMGDVNGLKLTNDVFGHSEGDVLLKTIADILRKACPQNTVIARWGGDEFVVLMPETTAQEAQDVCANITRLCENTMLNAVRPSISLGFATKADQSQNLTDILKGAEDNMYRHKLLESRSARSSIISSLQNALYEKSNETEEHARRIGSLCSRIGIELGLSRSDLDDLELLAMLHDIGKIVIDSNILNKRGPLNAEERAEMQKHTVIGYRIAKTSIDMSHIAEYILCHHEWWDGTGYPQGLKGEDIPLLSRILAIADAYDAITNDRVYKKARSHEEALDEIKKYSGTQFDPALVEIFLRVV